MTADDPLELRHRPIQSRGIARFEAILDAARAVLPELGYEHFTVEDVAARAAIPVGSVYQYFPNKYALIAEVAAQDTQYLVTAIDAAASAFPSQDWQNETDRLIEKLARMWRDDPWRPAVYAAMHSTAATRKRARENTAAVAKATIRPLTPLTPGLPDKQRYNVALVLVELCQTLLNLAVQNGTLNKSLVAETKRVIRAYLRSVALSTH